MGSVKLNKVKRSPGGTIIRNEAPLPAAESLDPAAMIAAVRLLNTKPCASFSAALACLSAQQSSSTQRRYTTVSYKRTLVAYCGRTEQNDPSPRLILSKLHHSPGTEA